MTGELDDRSRRALAWRLLGRVVRGIKPILIRGVPAGVIWQAAGALAPLAMAQIVDDGLLADDRGAVVRWSLVLLGLGLAEAFASRTRHKYACTARMHSAAALRQELLERVQRLDASFHDRTPAGDLLARATSDVEHISTLADCIPHTIGFLMSIVFVTGLLATVDPVVAVVVLGSELLLFVLVLVSSPAYRVRASSVQDAISSATVAVEETVTGFLVVKGLGAEPARAAVITDRAQEVRRRGLRLVRLHALVEPALELLPALTGAAALAVGGRRVLSGDLTVGGLLAALTYVAFLVWPMRVIGERIGTLQRALASAQRLVDVFSAQPQVVEAARPRPLPVTPALALRLDAVRFGYPGHLPVLDRLDLDVAGGARIAVVGGTGSGKTTLLQVAARAYEVDAGSVRLGGVDVREISLGELRSSVAVVGHDSVLFAGTLAENVAFARPGATPAEVETAARIAAVDDVAAALPQGYDTLLGERGLTLSGGQRQRVALARALLAQPRLLLLDDATSALDAATEERVVARLAAADAQWTLVVVTHRPATLQLADLVVLLDGGRVAATGTHAELLASNARYREVLAHTRDVANLVDEAVAS